MHLCLDCAYIGDKFSFPQPNDLPLANGERKALYCCCGDSDRYNTDITNEEISHCECFEEL